MLSVHRGAHGGQTMTSRLLTEDTIGEIAAARSSQTPWRLPMALQSSTLGMHMLAEMTRGRLGRNGIPAQAWSQTGSVSPESRVLVEKRLD